jgi:hypothetical protein
MTANRNYSSSAVRATLTAPVTDSATSMAVSSTSGWPSPPFTLIVDKDLSAEEVVTCTAVASLNLTVTRGQDGTTGVAHLTGATVQHGVSGRDFQEAGDHIGDGTIHPAAAIAESAPGRNLTGVATLITSVSSGPTTIVAAPAGGLRLVKSIVMAGPAGATVQLTLAGSTILNTTLTTTGLNSFDLTLPVAVGEAIAATVSAGPVIFTASYADRTDGVVQRLGMTSSSGTAQSVVAVGTARTISQLIVANTSRTTDTTVVVTIAGTAIMPTTTVRAGSIFTIDAPIAITSSQAITFTGNGVTAVTVIATGY